MTSTTNITSEWQEIFKEIQCYQDDEVNSVLLRLLKDKQFRSIITLLFSSSNKLEHQLDSLAEINSVVQLQSWVASNIFPLVAKSYGQFTVSGLSDLDPNMPYVFISNHRDIIMDPLLLNRALLGSGFSAANCAIGDNLLSNPCSNDLALLNRCFKIFRSIRSPRAILKAMKTQSAYIQHLHFNKHENIWIAQKEGRAKDNIDKTNPALIKMLGLARPKQIEISEYLSRLNIVPVSFSYEWDPCDIDKATELEALNTNENYTKADMDDFIATKKGIEGQKGNIDIHFGKVISEHDTQMLEHKSVSEIIDQAIQKNYHHYPVNFAAYKKVTGSMPKLVNSKTKNSYTKQEINQAGKQLEARLENQNNSVAKRVYQAYAQTLAHTSNG